jgi:hypothetical protein
MQLSTSEELRAINLHNVSDAVHLMNESSRGMSFEYNLDMFSFLSLARYWNFSYEHSLLRYVDGEPAALILNCIDPEVHDAFTFYWGTAPKFRSRRLSLGLFDASCKRLLDSGYVLLHGDAVPDRPVRRYRFVKAESPFEIVQLQAQRPNLPAADARFQVRLIDSEMMVQLARESDQPRHWCQRHSFFRNAASFLHFVGAFAGDTLQAYAAVYPQTTNTAILDLTSSNSSLAAGHELLRWLLVQDYRPPFIATYVFEQSYAYRLFTAAGFQVKRHLSMLSRDLRITC